MKTYISPRHLIRAALPASLLAITMLMRRLEDAVRCSWRKCHPASDMKLQTFYLTFHIARPRNNREREARGGAGTGSCVFQSFNKNAGVWRRSCLLSLTSQGVVELSALNLAAWRYPTTAAIHPGHCWTSINTYLKLCNICESPPSGC